MPESGEMELKIDPSRAAALVSQLQGVQSRIAAAANGRHVRLVAVSKLKPANDVLALHQASPSHLDFGENYAQELAQKAGMLPRSIRWHFIGGLQTGHCKTLARIPNLYSVSTVCTQKHAQTLENARASLMASTSSAPSNPSSSSSPSPRPAIPRLNVSVQVNTSSEPAKSGCLPGSQTLQLCRYVRASCPSLRLVGLMTIGSLARSVAAVEENEDFAVLLRERHLVSDALAADSAAAVAPGSGNDVDDPLELELSMGMSDDFETAVRMGSDEVRVGSVIFGQRPAKGDAKIVV